MYCRKHSKYIQTQIILINGIEKTLRCKATQTIHNGGILYLKRYVFARFIHKRILERGQVSFIINHKIIRGKITKYTKH